VNVSLVAVGHCCRHAAKGVADRRQPLPPPTAAGPAALQAAAAPRGSGPAFLDSGVSVLRRLADLSAHRKTRNPAALAPSGVADVLASAFKSETAGVQSLRENDSQVYASNPSSRAVFPLAAAPEAARFNRLGVRFLLRPDHHVSNTVRVLRDPSRQVLHVHVTPHPTAEWAAQQIVEWCSWDCKPPRFLVYDRDACYSTSFDGRVRNLGIAQARTPFRSPLANAIAEGWVRSVRTECLDHVFIFNEGHLQKVLAEYAGYFNHWRPHRSIGQRAPCAPRTRALHRSDQAGKIIAIPVLGGLHHVYQQAA
jgi:hypothetical protein